MTRVTIEDLQAVLNAEAEDVSPADDVLARASAHRVKGPRRGKIMIIAAVITTLLVGVLTVILRDAGSANPDRPASSHLVWRTFSSPSFGLTVQYPSTWRAATYDEVSSFTTAVVFFSDQSMTSPCKTSAGGSVITCSGGAVTRLTQGGVSVDWSSHGAPAPNLFNTAPGTPATISGVPAKVYIGADSDCSSIGGRTSVTATVQRPGVANNVFVMHACINADRNSRQVALVLASLHTMHQH